MLTALAVLAGLYLSLCLLVRFAYRAVLYPAPVGWVTRAPPSGAAELYAPSADGLRAHGWLYAAAGEQAPLVAFFHGNGETINRGVAHAEALAARGLRVLLVEYRGYGGSPGQPTEQGLYADAEALLRATRVPPQRVLLWGTSLGTGVASEMARRGHGRALALVAPYTSVPDVAARIGPFLPMGLLLGDAFDTRARAPAIALPVLLVHGTADQVIPYDMSTTLATTFPHARLVTIAGGGHNDLFVNHGDMIYDELARLALAP